MKIGKITLYISILFLIIWFVPVYTGLAQGAIVCKPPMVPSSDGYSCVASYHLLVPLTNPGNNTPIADLSVGDTNVLGAYLNLMIKLVIGLSAVLAMVMIVMGGLEYMTSGLISSKEEGRKRITNAILGLLLALGAYTLLFTINPELLNTKITIKQETVPADINNIDQPQTADANGNFAFGSKIYHQGDVWNEQLAGKNPDNIPSDKVSVKGPSCTTVGQQACTSTRGLNSSLLNETLVGCQKLYPNCTLTITGGTEGWLHSKNTTHGPNSPTIDISAENDALNKYITNGSATFPADNKPHQAPNGKCYIAEINPRHWHVSNSSCNPKGPW